MIKDAEDNKEKDAITKKRLNALSTLKNYMESVKNVLKDLEKQDSSVSKVSDEQKKTINKALKESLEWYENN